MWSATTSFSCPITYHSTIWYYTSFANTHSPQHLPHTDAHHSVSHIPSPSFKNHADHETFKFVFSSSTTFTQIFLFFLPYLPSFLSSRKSFHPCFQGTNSSSTHPLLPTNTLIHQAWMVFQHHPSLTPL